MNLLCNELGLDTISLGGTIAWAMECYERGLLTKEDTGGLEIRWGDVRVMKELIQMTARREGFGSILAEGVKRASQIIGRGTEKYAMHVKGLEIPMQQPRTVKMFALGHATSNRGADHLYALPTICYPHLREEASKYLGLSGADLDELTNVASWKHKARAVVFSENYCAVVDALGVCKFSTVETYAVTPELLAQGYQAFAGVEATMESLLEVGERIVNLERLFNAREGFNRKDDTLPERFTKEPLPSGPFAGSTVELEAMLEEYYSLRGWDPSTGLPTEETLSRLGLPPEHVRL
ncbi:MAG TPA: aldehyde:ferredoxin oxidoreductase, partial [Candidatus Korarchaeota archaeon]|nr:aldehyde:ferredoxin oxidoreductase [Candidatus Korarchaeota archaeon]